MIYFVKDSVTQAIKIGYSKKPTKRLGGLQTANPHKLVLLGTISGTPDDEAVYHGRFARHRLEGEWFTGEIIEEVLTIISAHKEQRLVIKRITMSETRDDGTAPEMAGNEAGITDKDSGICGICRIPALRMKTFSMKLTERSGDADYQKGHVVCGVEIKYVLQFAEDVTGDDLVKLQGALVETLRGPAIRLRHAFLDEDNAIVPFDVTGGSHIVGGREAITGRQGEGFRVLVAAEKALDPKHRAAKIKDVFMGENYTGEHPLKQARKLVVSVR